MTNEYSKKRSRGITSSRPSQVETRLSENETSARWRTIEGMPEPVIIQFALDTAERTDGPEAPPEQLVVREPQRVYASERVRVLTLRAGRIVATPARDSRAWISDNGDSPVPNVRHPSTTGSTVP